MSNKAIFNPVLETLENIKQTNLHLICALGLTVILMSCGSQPVDVDTAASRSKYDDLLPATDFRSEEARLVSDTSADSDLPQEAHETVLSLEDGTDQVMGEASEPISKPASELQVKPALLLDHSFTVQLGYFDSSAEASSFVLTHQLDADESGIAEVSQDGQVKYLLAYGVFSDKTRAAIVAKRMGEELGRPLEVVTLAEIEAIAGSVESSSGITTY